MAAKKKKADHITNPEMLGDIDYEAIFAAIKPLDQMAVDMETKWGVDRLPKLVSPDTGRKFGSAKAKFDQATSSEDPELVAKRANTLIRGWQAMDAEATAAGHNPIADEVEVWTAVDDNGKSFSVVKTQAVATHLAKANVAGKVYHLEEISRVIAWFEKKAAIVPEAKKLFPGAEVVGFNSRSVPEDDIPF
tara:strand:+ start:283 stop:855 length:573 start_codon:yes stop_codon:yes gene_type:complete